LRRYPSPSVFFSATPIFGRAELAHAVGRHPGDRAITELLKYHLRAGNIRRIARGVFASVSPSASASVTTSALPATGNVDRLLAASRLRIGAVIAYRSALELYGCATTGTDEVQLIARGEPGLIATIGFACRFVTPPRHHSPTEGVTIVDRQGLAVNATTLERTLIDVFDRYDLAGGAEDLFRSLDLLIEREIPLDLEALVELARRCGNATAAGALGYWLDRERRRLGVSDAVIEELRSLAPRHARYALGATPGQGRAATGWRVILPSEIFARYFDD
jgi:predicted transcriptional regulator of viral defense system